MPEYAGVSVTREEEVKTDRQQFDMTPQQEERAAVISKRIALMDQEKGQYLASKRRALMLYDGVFRQDGDPTKQATKEEIVAPIARIFVDSKTSEEHKAFSDFQFLPVDDENDAWRAELLSEVVEHVRRVTKARPKRLQLLRMKNIIGISVKWKSFKSTNIKMNVTSKIDENGNPIEWQEKDMPGESEIFEKIVDPLEEFWIDPNATSVDDALDCALYFKMNFEEGQEIFGNNPLYDFEGVTPGSDGDIEGLMYFKKPSGQPDVFTIHVWPSAGFGITGMKPSFSKEVFFGGLPDEHKMLPFVSYHNIPTYTRGFFQEFSQSDSGEPATASGSVSAKEKFWAYAGDPEIIMDLIDLRTSFGRSLYKACDLAGRSIVATDGNKRFDTSTDWEHGEQAVGMKGHYEVSTMGVANLAAFNATLDDLFNLMILTTGTDPRNLTDTKQKTLGETIAQRETQMSRLETIIDFNQEVAETRDGEITFKLIQQRYTEMKLVRLTGEESEEELKNFDEVEGEHPRTGKPLIGKRFRRIKTSKPFKELGAGQKKKLKGTDSGVNSFIARPEYIRTSEMDVAVLTKKKAGELQALKAQQLAEGIDKLVTLLPLTQPQAAGGKPLIDPKDLPPVSDLLREYFKLLGVNMEGKTEGDTEKSIKKLSDAWERHKVAQKPLAVPPQPVA